MRRRKIAFGLGRTRLRSEVVLSAEKLKERNVKWPSRCVVCDEQCQELGVVNAELLGWGPFVSLFPSKKFSLPAHASRRACGKSLSRHWFWVKNSTAFIASVLLIPLVLIVYFLHFSGLGIFVLVLVVVIGIVCNAMFDYAMRPNAWIEEVPPKTLMGKKDYKFSFVDKQYAQEFERLNADLLVSSSNK